MKSPLNNQGMPLFLWGWIFFITLVAVLSLFLILGYRTKYVIKPNKEKVIKYENYQNLPNDRLDFYLIGSSLLSYAIIQDNYFNNLVSGNNLKINYEVAICGGSSLYDFNYLINEIRKKQPKYIFIESNVICINQVNNFRGRLLHIPKNFIKVVGDEFKLHTLFGNTDQVNKGNKQLDFDNQGLIENMADEVLFTARKINEFPLWNDFFKEAENLGIKIYLLELPRSLEADNLMIKTFMEQYDELVKKYSEVFKIEYIDFPEKLSRDKYYIDRAHFNKIGSEYYCNWLLTEFCTREMINCNK